MKSRGPGVVKAILVDTMLHSWNLKSGQQDNRAIIFCSTTDAYQVIHHPDAARCKELNLHRKYIVRRALELIRDQSTLNVRILTRSPLARLDFDLFKSFGNRLVLGMSIPTMRNDLAKIYEPGAPAPSQRLAALKAASQAGIAYPAHLHRQRSIPRQLGPFWSTCRNRHQEGLRR